MVIAKKIFKIFFFLSFVLFLLFCSSSQFFYFGLKVCFIKEKVQWSLTAKKQSLRDFNNNFD